MRSKVKVASKNVPMREKKGSWCNAALVTVQWDSVGLSNRFAFHALYGTRLTNFLMIPKLLIVKNKFPICSQVSFELLQ